jgi:hypothetical protein
LTGPAGRLYLEEHGRFKGVTELQAASSGVSGMAGAVIVSAVTTGVLSTGGGSSSSSPHPIQIKQVSIAAVAKSFFIICPPLRFAVAFSTRYGARRSSQSEIFTTAA